METEYTIEIKNVKKSFRVYYDKGNMLKEKLLFRERNRYEEREVLKGISFNIKKGEAVGLIGQNGCGKSTTLKLLTKIIYPDSGSIEVKGRVSSLLELGAGFHPDMTGRENIYINASIFGLSKKEIDTRLESIIEFSELGEYMDNPVRTYSSGMYMRLAFSVAISVNADVLLIDEILAVGDANFQMKCLNKLDEIKRNGTTIVIVSHSMVQIEAICERCIWLNKGLIEGIGATEVVEKQYKKYMNVLMGKAEEAGDGKAQKAEDVQNEEKSAGKEVKNLIDLTSIAVTDEEGQHHDIFELTDTILLKLEYCVQKEIRARIRIEIVRSDYVLCYGMVYNNAELYHLKKEGHITISFPQIMLLSGKYYINLYFESDSGERLAKMTPVADFAINGYGQDYGIAKMISECEVG